MNEDLYQSAKDFLRKYSLEEGVGGIEHRLGQVKEEIDSWGYYEHTSEELEYGAKVAWRNSNRCIGRLFWKSLKVRDRRALTEPEAIFEDLCDHLDYAFNEGKIRSVISVYRQVRPDKEEIRIVNPQMTRYAGHIGEQGQVIGDKAMVPFTRYCTDHGWRGGRTAFDVLPVVIKMGEQKPVLFEFPQERLPEVNITHSDYDRIGELGLRWYAVPVISNMMLEIGGIAYSAAPFNGWYMVTEIGSRNFGDKDRYGALPEIANSIGLDCGKDPLWKDKALLILNEAVLQSFQNAGVTIASHHDASDQFIKFCEREEEYGREVKADWSWIVPPMSGSATQVFHHRWENSVQTPNFFYRKSPWEAQDLTPEERLTECPFFSKQP